MRIQVHSEKGETNRKAGFDVQVPGEYEFPDDPKFAGWLQGKIARGAISIIPEKAHSLPPPEAFGPTAGSEPEAGTGDPVHSEAPPEAEGLTAGSTTGEPDTVHSLPPPEAEGPTAPATPDVPGVTEHPASSEPPSVQAERAGEPAPRPSTGRVGGGPPGEPMGNPRRRG